MNLCEAHRVRHLVVRLDRGDELPHALVRALDLAEARAGFITGVGALEAAELAHYDQARRTYDKARRIDAPCEVLALSGNVAVLDGAASVRLSAVLSRETDVGLSTLAGQLVWGRAFSLELHVTVFDDVTLARVADERTGLPVLEARGASRPPRGDRAPDGPARDGQADPAPDTGAEAAPRPPGLVTMGETPRPPAQPDLASRLMPPREARPASPPPAAVQGYPQAVAPPAHVEAPAIPQRPQKPAQDLDLYPDVGDKVVHFHFGECTVVTSDGDRIRLRQDKEGRVLDVALTKLRIEPSAVDPDGTRHFRLHRKN